MLKRITSLYLFVLLLSLFIISCDDSDPVAPSEEHFGAEGFVIKDDNGNIIFRELKGQLDMSVSSSFALVLADGEKEFVIEFLDEDGINIGVPGEDTYQEFSMIEIETDEHHSLLFEYKDNSLFEIEVDDWEFEINPLKIGNTEFRIRIFHEGHPDFTSPYFPLEIK